jgi:hypothetical protein
MTEWHPGRRVFLTLLWLGLPVLSALLYQSGARLHEDWRARTPTEVEVIDCRIDGMMGGDNPIEVRRIERTCLEAVNDAYVAPRLGRLLLGFCTLLLAYVAAASLATWRLVTSDP